MEKARVTKKTWWSVAIFSIIAIISITLGLTLKYAGGGQPNSGNDTGNIKDSSDTAVTKVGEIWSGSAFYTSRFNKLLSYLSSAGTLDALSSGTIKASDIYTSTNGGKTANTSLVVTFGGLEWIVTYISQDKSGNPIATLWLSSSTQDEWKTGTYKLGKYTSLSSGNLESMWGSYGSTAYPGNIYGTSYIRAVTLNIGGKYIISSSNPYTSSYTQNASNPFAKFTMANGNGVTGSVTDYLVTPSQVSWQESQVQNFGWDYYLPNDAWGSISGKNWGEGQTDYPNKEGYTLWKDDYIWLPSLTETGYSDTYTGLWGTNTNERVNTSESWLRSGNYGEMNLSYYLLPIGIDRSNLYIDCMGGVRPALHLNLKSAAQAAGALITSITNTEIGDVSDQTYTGSALTPNPTITYNGTTLTEGTDYTLSYSNNINAGEATITITGMGDYEGTTTKTFNITQATNSWTTQPRMAGWTYGETAKSPAGAAKFGKVTFQYKKSTEADTAYTTAAPSAVGAYTMKASVDATTNYTSISTTVNFTISQASNGWKTPPRFSGTGISGTGGSSNPYVFAKSLTPTKTAVAKFGSPTYQYKKITESDTAYSDIFPTTAGRYMMQITVAAATNYGGLSTEIYFNITDTFSSGICIILNDTKLEYTGSSVEVSVASVVCDGATLAQGTDFDISYKSGSITATASSTKPSAIGIHFVVITGKGLYSGKAYAPFEIIKGRVETPTFDKNWFEYTGSLITFSPTYDTTKINISGNTGTNAGEYTATFTLKDTTHYEWNDGTTTAKTLNWLIAKKVIPKPTVKSSVKFTYTGYEQEILPEHLDNWIEGVMVITGGNKFTNVGKYTLQVALTTEGAKNYVWRE